MLDYLTYEGKALALLPFIGNEYMIKGVDLDAKKKQSLAKPWLQQVDLG